MSNWLNTRYEDVFAFIQAGISNGELVPGERLEGERKLAERLGLSRETIRIGLNLAEEAGLIVRVPQRGTFVAQPKVAQDLGNMVTFKHSVRDLAMAPAYQLRKAEWIALPGDVAEKLQVEPGSQALSVEVIGMANALPMALYSSAIPKAVIDDIGEDHPWGERASYEFAAAALGLEQLNVTQELEAVTLAREHALTLKVRIGSPGFHSQSIFSSPSGRRLELRTTYYPGARYRFKLSRKITIQS